MKEEACSDEPTENYNLNLQLLSALRGIINYCSTFQIIVAAPLTTFLDQYQSRVGQKSRLAYWPILI